MIFIMVNNQLPQWASHRDFGVLLLFDLSWSCHYDHICANAYKSLVLFCRTFSNYHATEAKKTLYNTLVRSKLIYNSQLWNPHLIKDIINLERVQCCTIKFILNDFTSNYKCCLSKLNMLYICMITMSSSFSSSISNTYPSNHFDITQYVTFGYGNTRSTSHNKLYYKYSTNNLLCNSYFCRLPRTWNALPPMDLSKPFTVLKSSIIEALWKHFMINFNSEDPCTYISLCLFLPKLLFQLSNHQFYCIIYWLILQIFVIV